MNKVVAIAKVLLLVSASLFLLACTFIVWQAGKRINSPTGILARLEGLESKANATLVNLDGMTANLNQASRDWSASSKQQSQNILDLTKHFSVTLSGVDMAVADARGTLGVANAQLSLIGPILRDADTSVRSIAPLLESAKRTADAVQPSLESLRKTIADMDVLINNPYIPQTIKNTSDVTSATATTMQHVSGIARDAQIKADQLIAPHPWYTSIGSWAQLGTEWLLRWYSR